MHSFRLSVLVLAGCLSVAKAQQQQPAFNLTSPGLNVDNLLSECEAIELQVVPLTNSSAVDAVPPFYMLSFELGGIARSDFLGIDPQNLTWTIRHPQGAVVFAYAVDGRGNISEPVPSVGVIQAGNTSNCHPTQSQSSFKIVADASQVATCNELSTTITGGIKPYTVTIVEGDFVANFTLGEHDDGFNYVNQVSPGGVFLVAASDSKGQWAAGTNLISSVGSTDLSCPGEESSGTSSGSNSSNKVPLIGGIVGGIIFILLAIGLAFYFYIKRRGDTRLSAMNQRQAPFDYDDVSPYVLPPDASIQMQNFFAPSSSHQPSSTGSASDTSGTVMQFMDHYPMALTGEQLPSHSGSIYYNASSNAQGTVHRPPSEHMAGRRLHLVDQANLRPMTEKEQLMAKDEEGRRQQVILHEDSDDILDVPPVYKERVGGPSGGSAN